MHAHKYAHTQKRKHNYANLSNKYACWVGGWGGATLTDRPSLAWRLDCENDRVCEAMQTHACLNEHTQINK